MKNSILYIGAQGTGKTTKIKTLVSCLNQDKVKEMTFDEFWKSMKSIIIKKYDFIVIDEVTTTEQFDYLMACIKYGFTIILGTQLPLKELELYDLSMFHIVELGSKIQ